MLKCTTSNKTQYFTARDSVSYTVQSCCHRGKSLLSVTIERKATEQYFPAVLFIVLHKVVLTFGFVDEILKCDHSNESY